MDDPPFVSYEGKQVKTSEAVFIIVSDFGSEAKSYGMSKERLENEVYREMEKLWTDPKQRDLLQYIIPFVPLKDNHLRQIVELQLHDLLALESFRKAGILRIEWDESALPEESVPGVLTTLAKRRDKAKFARSIADAINTYVKDPVLKRYQDDLFRRRNTSSSTFVRGSANDKFVVKLQANADKLSIDVSIEKLATNPSSSPSSSNVREL
eukprot:TRINITY_DN5508_c0_g1_i2.p1 TRINITY_DN5508_c0_g1~~TRINITY_DN5508_c0_g1_i2.p1  ORF type:complete len:210 (-),score=56.49 TRINITY_DN5508_c0_g1_i2:29-658(-)